MPSMPNPRRAMLLGLSLLLAFAHTARAQPFLRTKQAASLSLKTPRTVPAVAPSPDTWRAVAPSAPRGGACSDSDPALFLKVGVGAVAEAALMLGILKGTEALAAKHLQVLPDVAGLSILQWLGLVVVIFASSFLGSIVDGSLSAATRQVLAPNELPGDPDWYDGLVKPWWNPPGWLFPIMWLVVSKPTQLVAVARILTAEGGAAVPPLALYCTHLALGDAWNKVFFGLQCPGRGAAVISAFLGLLAASAYVFGTVDRTAGLFMLPTCGWVFVAACLNWSIYLSNRE